MADNGRMVDAGVMFGAAALFRRQGIEGNKMPPIKSFRRIFILRSPFLCAWKLTDWAIHDVDAEIKQRIKHDTGTLSVCLCVCAGAIKVLFAQRKWGENCIFGRIEFITHLFIALYAANCSRTGMEWGAQTCKTVVSMRFKSERDKWINLYSIRDHFLHGFSSWRFLIFSICHPTSRLAQFPYGRVTNINWFAALTGPKFRKKNTFDFLRQIHREFVACTRQLKYFRL